MTPSQGKSRKTKNPVVKRKMAKERAVKCRCGREPSMSNFGRVYILECDGLAHWFSVWATSESVAIRKWNKLKGCDLQATIDQLRKELSATKEELRQLHAYANNLERLNNEKNQDIDQLRAERDALRGGVETLTSQLNDTRRVCAETTMRLTDERDALASKFYAVVKEVEALQAQLAERERVCVWQGCPRDYQTGCGRYSACISNYCSTCGGRVQIKTDKEG